jgi:hypothetical protein
VAGSDHAAGTVGGSGDFDRADAAGTVGFQLGSVAERGNVTAAFEAVDEAENGFAGLEAAGDAIDPCDTGGIGKIAHGCGGGMPEYLREARNWQVRAGDGN